MKVQVLEVLWHTANDKGKSDPVMSIDFTFDRLLASGGADKEVKEDDAGSVSVDFIASLEGHMKGVNAVRFSPDGMALASAGGDEAVIIWTLHPHISSWADVKSRKDVSRTVLRKMGEVYDLAWSPDSASLMCGSVDNSCYVWDVVPKRRATLLGASEPPRPELSNTITQHSHFVTGVAWDPAGAHLATLGNDRTLRVHTRKVPGWMHEVLGAARERKVAANPPDGSGLPQQVPGAPPGLQQQNFMGLSLRPTRKKDKALELAATCRTVEWEAGDAAEGSAAKGTLFLDEQ
ncbi:FAS2, partial [Symbiodinium sp. KB8]